MSDWIPISSLMPSPTASGEVKGMRQYNWRAPSPQPSKPPNGEANEELLSLTSSKNLPESCLPITLSTSITISLSPHSTATVPQVITYTPTCTELHPVPTGTGTHKTPNKESGGTDLPASTLRDPFYASTIPMAYSISTTITLSYILLFLLFLSTPRPWLQKVATLTVVICLTMAFIETTAILEEEYSRRGETWVADTESGSAKDIRERVVGGTEMRVGRIISDTFLWLAQVQTLIRLFPRHREKIVIKWAGFALIVLDTVFSILVHFLSPTTAVSPESFLDAIPALSYLFQIALSLLYGACVVYYSLSSRIRRFAYYHPKAPNNILIAILSLISVLIPMVFFCLDISQRDLAAWGDYVRWVGAAAASVVVWEWVDRIERLEREERREGVLGRELFDGDDGLGDDMGVNADDHYPDNPKNSRSGDSGGNNGGVYASGVEGTTAPTALADNAGATLNRRLQNSISALEDRSSSPSNNGARIHGAADTSALSSAWTAPTEDGSESNGRRSSISFVGVRNTDRRSATTPSYSDRSTPGPVSNRTTVIDEEDALEISENSKSNETMMSEENALNERANNEVSGQSADSVSQPSNITLEQGDRSWFILSNPFKRSRSTLQQESSPEAKKPTWTTKILSNLPSSRSNSFTSVHSSFLSSSSSSKTSKKSKQESAARRLPVTFIPAPARERCISLRELEEARRNGVGDEGVGVWTANSLREKQSQPQNPSGAPLAVVMEGSCRRSPPPPPSDGYSDDWSHSSNRGGATFQSPQHRISSDHYMQQQFNRNSYPTASLTSSLPPLPPSPAATASSASAWGGSQTAYSIQQAQLFANASPGSLLPPPTFSTAISSSSTPTAPSLLPPPQPPPPPPPLAPIMSGALQPSSKTMPPTPTPNTSQTPASLPSSPPTPHPPLPPPALLARQGSGGPTRLARSRSLASGLGIVKEGVVPGTEAADKLDAGPTDDNPPATGEGNGHDVER